MNSWRISHLLLYVHYHKYWASTDGIYVIMSLVRVHKYDTLSKASRRAISEMIEKK